MRTPGRTGSGVACSATRVYLLARRRRRAAAASLAAAPAAPPCAAATTSAIQPLDRARTSIAFLAERGVDLAGRAGAAADQRARSLGSRLQPAVGVLVPRPRRRTRAASWPRCTTPTASDTATSCSQTSDGRCEADKAFYVSPFLDRRRPLPHESPRARRPARRSTIELSQDGGRSSRAVAHRPARRTLSTRALSRMLVRYPLMTAARDSALIRLHGVGLLGCVACARVRRPGHMPRAAWDEHVDPAASRAHAGPARRDRAASCSSAPSAELERLRGGAPRRRAPAPAAGRAAHGDPAGRVLPPARRPRQDRLRRGVHGRRLGGGRPGRRCWWRSPAADAPGAAAAAAPAAARRAAAAARTPRTPRGRAPSTSATTTTCRTTFFALFLDETMTYSCAVFEPGDSLAEPAQRRKYDAVCRPRRRAPPATTCSRSAPAGAAWRCTRPPAGAVGSQTVTISGRAGSACAAPSASRAAGLARPGRRSSCATTASIEGRFDSHRVGRDARGGRRATYWPDVLRPPATGCSRPVARIALQTITMPHDALPRDAPQLHAGCTSTSSRAG